jgi:hypothetical protein
MWPFNQPTKGDLQKRIDHLENVIDDEVETLRQHLRSAEREFADKVEYLEERQQNLIEAVNRTAVEDLPDKKVPKKRDELYTLQQDCVGYKRTQHSTATLVLPEGTRVVYARGCDWELSSSTKLRANQAIVARLEKPEYVRDRAAYENGFTFTNGDQFEQVADHSTWAKDFQYTVGKVVTPDNDFDGSTATPCSAGIHFYRTPEEAV